MASLILRSTSGASLRRPPPKTKSVTRSILSTIIPKKSTSWCQAKPKQKLIHEAVEAVVGAAEVVAEEVEAAQKLMNRMNKKPKKILLSHAEAGVNEAQTGVSEAEPGVAEEMLKVSSSTNDRAWMTKDKNNVS